MPSFSLYYTWRNNLGLYDHMILVIIIIIIIIIIITIIMMIIIIIIFIYSSIAIYLRPLDFDLPPSSVICDK